MTHADIAIIQIHQRIYNQIQRECRGHDGMVFFFFFFYKYDGMVILKNPYYVQTAKDMATVNPGITL